MSPEPLQPSGLGTKVPGLPGDKAQRGGCHDQVLPPATAPTARRQSSSRACRYTVVEATATWPSSAQTTSRSVPARTQFGHHSRQAVIPTDFADLLEDLHDFPIGTVVLLGT